MMVDKDKNAPAFEGARYNSRGFCIHHAGIRLCRVTADGEFVIVRKICFKCGKSKNDVHDKTKKTKKKLHGAAKCQRKKSPTQQHRDSPSSEHNKQRISSSGVPYKLLSSTARDRKQHRITSGGKPSKQHLSSDTVSRDFARISSSGVPCRIKTVERRGVPSGVSSSSSSSSGYSKQRSSSSGMRNDITIEQQRRHPRQIRSPSPIRKRSSGSGRRRNTLSPIRRSLNRKIILSPCPSSAPNGGSDLRPKVTVDKINELRRLQPPPLHDQGSGPQASASTRSNSQKKEIKPPRVSTTSTSKEKERLPFDSKGFCKYHPDHRLAKKNDTGGWDLVSGVCPQCCVSAVLVLASKQDVQLSSSSTTNKKSSATKSKKRTTESKTKKHDDSIIGKLLNTTSDSHTQPTSSSTQHSGSYLSTPESIKSSISPAFEDTYFTSRCNKGIIGLALDIQRSEEMEKGMTPDPPAAVPTWTFKKSIHYVGPRAA